MTHKTHQMRYSDSSFVDEVCELCGEGDPCIGSNPKLDIRCSKASETPDFFRGRESALEDIITLIKSQKQEAMITSTVVKLIQCCG